jgi:DNA repair exonuclease SbcCD ATPase subunit
VHFKTLKCEFDGTITEIIGMNGSGKTTIVNALWMAIKGIALKGNDCIIGDRFKFIQNGKKSMDVEIALIDENHDNARILVKRHVLKSSSKLTFKAPDDYPISHEWLQNLLSVSFLSAKNFTMKNKKEQALLLGIDTAEYDRELAALKSEYTMLNREHKAFGDLGPVEKVEKVDIQELIQLKRNAQEKAETALREIKKRNDQLREKSETRRKNLLQECIEHNKEQERLVSKLQAINESYNLLKQYGYEGNEVAEWINTIPKPQERRLWEDEINNIPEPEYLDENLDTIEIDRLDNQIMQASETNQKAAEYERYLTDMEQRDAKKTELVTNQARQQEVIQSRVEYIQSYDLNFDGLEIDEDGGLILNGREIREPYFSKGELEKIVAMLRASINDELKVIFIDDFDLLDEKNQKEIPEYLVEKGFQVIVAKVGRSEGGKNIISLSEPIEEKQPPKPKLI